MHLGTAAPLVTILRSFSENLGPFHHASHFAKSWTWEVYRFCWLNDSVPVSGGRRAKSQEHVQLSADHGIPFDGFGMFGMKKAANGDNWEGLSSHVHAQTVSPQDRQGLSLSFGALGLRHQVEAFQSWKLYEVVRWTEMGQASCSAVQHGMKTAHCQASTEIPALLDEHLG